MTWLIKWRLLQLHCLAHTQLVQRHPVWHELVESGILHKAFFWRSFVTAFWSPHNASSISFSSVRGERGRIALFLSPDRHRCSGQAAWRRGCCAVNGYVWLWCAFLERALLTILFPFQFCTWMWVIRAFAVLAIYYFKSPLVAMSVHSAESSTWCTHHIWNTIHFVLLPPPPDHGSVIVNSFWSS